MNLRRRTGAPGLRINASIQLQQGLRQRKWGSASGQAAAEADVTAFYDDVCFAPADSTDQRNTF
jgi:hypothetical protein